MNSKLLKFLFLFMAALPLITGVSTVWAAPPLQTGDDGTATAVTPQATGQATGVATPENDEDSDATSGNQSTTPGATVTAVASPPTGEATDQPGTQAQPGAQATAVTTPPAVTNPANQPGVETGSAPATLPTTGGEGTIPILFFTALLVGGILMIISGVMLISRESQASNKE